MSRKPLTGLVVAMTAATLQLSGCGKIPNQSPVPPSHQHVTPPAEQQVAQEPTSDLQRMHRDMLAALNLTDEQRTQLRAIKARYRDQMRDGQFRAQLEQMRALVLAPTVDKAALVQAINATHEYKLSKIPVLTNKLADVREVLTPQQRSTAVTAINDMRDSMASAIERLRREAFQDLSANLNLTSQQAQALQELQEQHREVVNTILPDMRTAITQFLLDGNQQNLVTSLQSAMAASRTTDLVDDSADFVVSLNPVQRQQLVANYTSLLAKMKAMHRAMHSDMDDSAQQDDTQ